MRAELVCVMLLLCACAMQTVRGAARAMAAGGFKVGSLGMTRLRVHAMSLTAAYLDCIQARPRSWDMRNAMRALASGTFSKPACLASEAVAGIRAAGAVTAETTATLPSGTTNQEH